MPVRALTALPVYNEAQHVHEVLDQVLRHADEVLVVDDGSTDGTRQQLQSRTEPQLHVVSHKVNRGYGAALRTAFQYAIDQRYDVVVTVDCDGQHEPCRIPRFVDAAGQADIVSGSRYLKQYPGDSLPPADRRQVNVTVTRELNRRLGLSLTDAFCGFKAYRVEVMKRLRLSEDGYAMPLELWVQATYLDLTIQELPVPLIYLDAKRSFGGALDDADARLQHYRDVLDRGIAAAQAHYGVRPALLCGEGVG